MAVRISASTGSAARIVTSASRTPAEYEKRGRRAAGTGESDSARGASSRCVAARLGKGERRLRAKRAFVGEEPALALEAAGVADQPAVGADGAVARNDQPDRIGAVRGPDGAYRGRGAHGARQRGVAGRLAHRNAA